MAPLIVLVICWAIFRGLGRVAVPALDSMPKSGRAALAVMFLFTGTTHFTGLKHEYLAMLPAGVPGGLHLIHLTGFLEIAGAFGLLYPPTRRLAAVCLVLLLLAMFPANVNASLQSIPFRGGPPMSLWIRIPIQCVFILGLWFAAMRRTHPESLHRKAT